MKKILPLLLLLLCICSASCNFFTPPKDTGVYEVKITAVVDGDTIKVQFTDKIPTGCNRTETVRLIGVNTPELRSNPPEYYAREARDFVNQYYQAIVHLETDPDTSFRDKYNRLLAYVHIDFYDSNRNLLNEQLIREGYGYYYDVFTFNRQHMYEFKNAENTGKYKKKGVWK